MNSYVQPLLTDLYEITMCNAYFEAGKHEERAVFDLFFRKNPFHGEFTVFAGLSDCLKYISDFRFSESDIDYLKTVMPSSVKSSFYDYLKSVDCSKIKLHAIKEGSVVFPRVPLLIVEGPLAVCQLLETTLLNLVNYACLVTTNAARCRLVAGENKELLEFGLRRAQGPDGAMSASKYAYIGGFDATSNVLAGKNFGIPVCGTHAHSFVSAFEAKDLKHEKFVTSKIDSSSVNLTHLVIEKRKKLVHNVLTKVVYNEINDGELASFISYATSFPGDFLALIDTYDVLKSGVVNFCSCCLALHELGYKAKGVRIDSGDLAYLSKQVRAVFRLVAENFEIDYFDQLKIVGSNDLNEDTLLSLNDQKHEIDCFAIGTHLVTCQKQPALGGVYKLVELNGKARIKLSEDHEKILIPGRKRCYRLYGKDGHAINDLMTLLNEEKPREGQTILCTHPFLAAKRAFVMPSKVEALHKLVWNEGKLGIENFDSLSEIRDNVQKSLKMLRNDIKRPLNPTPYKISVTESLFNFLHQLWHDNAPIGRLE